MSSDTLLASLNSSQKAAVCSSAQSLAILAGPGSGKTHTLTSRTAWLLKHEGLQPWNIIVATFTVKAAREMKERIGKLIGDGLESKLVLGTFHSIARRYLARYGHLINIPKDFGIADSSDSLAIIKRIVKRHKLTIDAAAARARISGRKAKGSEYELTGSGKHRSKSLEVQEFEICYNEYEEALKRSNLLDYDDLLLRCVDLLRAYPSCVSNVEAVLIDEFQDTNLVQFDLMRLFASQKKRVTIVGDPDQSIYGFRSAETKNFKRMLTQYPETVTIPLEENYRSSGAILLTALEVIQQDEGRIAKSLMPTHNVGTRPVLRKLASAHVEAQWVITEIKRSIALTGDLMTFNDFAILLRSASLSRHIESALGKAGIAYRMVGGHRFFDRVEVKIVLDYMRVINQPDNNDALARIVNVPPRHIGETTVKSLLEEADQSAATLWNLILQHVRGMKNVKPRMTKPTEQGLSSFVNLILGARKKFLDPSNSESSVTQLMEFIIRKTSLEEFIEKSYPDDHESRWANIEELINQASDFSNLLSLGQGDDGALPEVEGLVQNDISNPLSKFLANIALASDVKAIESSTPTDQVTISTIHSAKGLEWPVVFIPAAYEGSIPHSRADDADEERRLLYVAMTRAKVLLYLSYPLLNSRREQAALSSFLTPSTLKSYLDEKGPSFSSHVTQSIAQILKRPIPKIDFELLKSLGSLEDDQFPLDGDKIGGTEYEVIEGGGSHHYTQGQRPPKRHRIEDFGESSLTREIWQPSYSTTMDQSSSFSKANTTINTGFISAGSHLKELNERPINSVTKKPPVRSCESRKPTLNEIQGGTDQQQVKKASVGRTSRRPEGQKSMLSFLTSSSIQSCPVTSPAGIRPAQKPFAEERAERHSDIQLPRFATASENLSGILPALANRRIGSAILSAPIRFSTGERCTTKKPYVFLSSSPPRLKIHSESLQDAAQTEPPNARHESDSLALERNVPVATMHMTTMDHVSSNQLQKKTYGIKRTMNGWSHRKGRDFVPPRRVGPS